MNLFSWNGITLDRWTSTFFFSLCISGVLIGSYYFLQNAFDLTGSGNGLEVSDKVRTHFPFWQHLLLYFGYCFSQEFIARGVIQTSLQDFFEDLNGFIAIAATACLVSLFQLTTAGFIPAALSFCGSLFLGYVFIQQKSLLGVTIIHFIVGSYFLHFML